MSPRGDACLLLHSSSAADSLSGRTKGCAEESEQLVTLVWKTVRAALRPRSVRREGAAHDGGKAADRIYGPRPGAVGGRERLRRWSEEVEGRAASPVSAVLHLWSCGRYTGSKSCWSLQQVVVTGGIRDQ